MSLEEEFHGRYILIVSLSGSCGVVGGGGGYEAVNVCEHCDGINPTTAGNTGSITKSQN